jgi:hypothetical protein
MLRQTRGGKRQSGCVSEPRRVQEGPDFRIDGLLLLFADYTSPVQGVGFYGHQSRRSRIFDWKDYFHIQLAVHCDVTGRKDLLARSNAQSDAQSNAYE